MSEEFLKEIDIKCVPEILSERFDDAIDLMPADALIYGGALRDIAARLELLGDLDIAVDQRAFKTMVQRFRDSSKWTEEGVNWSNINHPVQPPKAPRGSSSGRGLPSPTGDFLRKVKKSSRPYAENLPIDGTLAFLTYNNARVQLIKAKTTKKNGFDCALEIVKNVDFVCCGMAMDNVGKVFEVLDGAYDDCTGRILRLNKAIVNVDIAELKARIKKLEQRGWTSKVNVKIVERRMAKRQKAEEERYAKMDKERPKSGRSGRKGQILCEFMTMETWEKGHGYPGHRFGSGVTIFVDRKRINLGLNRIIRCIDQTASKLNLSVSHGPTAENAVKIDIASISGSKGMEFGYEMIEFMKHEAAKEGIHLSRKGSKKGISYSSRDAKKKKQLKTKYGSKPGVRGRAVRKKKPMPVEEIPQDDAAVEAEAYDDAPEEADSYDPGYFDAASNLNAGLRAHGEAMPAPKEIGTLTFRAALDEDGDIYIEQEEGGDGPFGSVTINVDDLPAAYGDAIRDELNNSGEEEEVRFSITATETVTSPSGTNPSEQAVPANPGAVRASSRVEDLLTAKYHSRVGEESNE